MSKSSLATVLAAVSMALLMAGCAASSPAPGVEEVHEELSLPEAWSAASASTSCWPNSPAEVSAPNSTAGEPCGAWWVTFGDPTLDGFVVEALAHNYDLVAAASRLDAAVAEARVAGADLWPSLSASGAGSRAKRNFVGFPDFGGALDPDAPATGGSDVLSITNNNYGVSFDLSWELDLWGRVRSSHSAARMDALAVADEVAAIRHSIAAQTVKAYFTAIEATQQLAVAESNLASFESSSAKVRSRYESGLGSLVDLRTASAAAARARAEVPRRRGLLSAASRQLELVLGRYPAAEIAAAGQFPALTESVPAGLPAELLLRRADLAGAARRLEAAGFRAASRRAALLPRLSLTASSGRSSAELSDLLDGSFGVWSLAGNLVQPIFQGGRLRAQVEAADAKVSAAAAAYADSVLVAASEVETALQGEELLELRERAMAEAVDHSQQALRLAERNYASGLGTYLDVLIAERVAFDSSRSLLELRRGRLDNRVNLFLALGGGFPTTLSAALESQQPEQLDELVVAASGDEK
jgi:multidrug efflux system outer membrane protein